MIFNFSWFYRVVFEPCLKKEKVYQTDFYKKMFDQEDYSINASDISNRVKGELAIPSNLVELVCKKTEISDIRQRMSKLSISEDELKSAVNRLVWMIKDENIWMEERDRHSLIQDAERLSGKDSDTLLAKAFVIAVKHSGREYQSNKGWENCTKLDARNYIEAIRENESWSRHYYEKTANEAVNLSKEYQHEDALAMRLVVLSERRKMYRKDSEAVLIAEANVAFSYSHLGLHEKAYVLRRHVLETRQTRYNETNDKLLKALSNYAYTKKRMEKKYSEKEMDELYKQFLVELEEG